MTSLSELFRERTAESPRQDFLRTARRSLDLGETEERVLSLAAGFEELGVDRGDVVAMAMTNSIEFVLVWFALAELGACPAFVNPSATGSGLAVMLARSGARVVVADRRCMTALRAARDEVDAVRLVVVADDAEAEGIPPGAHDLLPGEMALNDLFSSSAKLGRRSHPGDDLGVLIYTSGTSGSTPSACMFSNDYILKQARVAIDWFDLTSADTFFAALPLIHIVSSTLGTVPCLITGATFSPGRFRAESFWQSLGEVGGTVFPFVGATLTELWKQPERATDADNPARLGFGVPIPSWVREFEERFGLRLVTGYGMSEVVMATYNKGPVAPGVQQSGHVREGIELKIFDEMDYEVEPGDLGEIVVRPTRPREMIDGYHNEPERTVAALSNLWFHTGDVGKVDRDGVLYFEGRKKDVVRRRGETISPLQVEEAILTHPEITECAVFGVPSELLDEELVAVVVLRPSAETAPAEIFAFCRGVLPRYMVPYYLRIRDESLPRSGSNKVEKYRLVDEGLTPDTIRRQDLEGAR